VTVGDEAETGIFPHRWFRGTGDDPKFVFKVKVASITGAREVFLQYVQVPTRAGGKTYTLFFLLRIQPEWIDRARGHGPVELEAMKNLQREKTGFQGTCSLRWDC